MIAASAANDPANASLTDAQLKSELQRAVSSGELKLSQSEINTIVAARQKSEEVIKSETTFSTEWWKSKITEARATGASVDAIADAIINTTDEKEIKNMLKAGGYTKWYKGLKGELKNYIEATIK